MGQTLMLNVAAFAVQVCVIVIVAAMLLRVLHIASAGTRYLCWRLVLAACIAMPLLLQKTIHPATPTEVAIGSVDDQEALAPATATRSDVSTAAPVRPQSPIPWAPIAAAVIAAGAVLRAGWLAVGLYRLRVLHRRGVPVDDADYADIQRTLGTHAVLSRVIGLTQPATFGLRRPVVLLPDTLADSPPALRQAVVTHELFHVQRRDWLWVLAEEALRTVLWFHPAIAWLTSRIQLAREELVDELTVLATGNRKAYIEALLAFADSGRMRPAPAFARRRHLYNRIVRLSKESVMSSARTVASAAAVIASVLATGWYASSLFPVVAAAPVIVQAVQTDAPWRSSARRTWIASGRETQESSRVAEDAVTSVTGPTNNSGVIWQLGDGAAAQGPRSGGAPRPGPAAVASPAPGTNPITPENPIPRRLSSVSPAYPATLRGSGYRGAVTVRVTLDASGRISDVQRLAADVVGDASTVDRAVAATAFFDATAEAVRQWRYQSPADPPIAFFVDVRFDAERDAVVSQGDVPAGRFRAAVATPGFPGVRVGAGAPIPTAAIASLQQQLENASAALELALQRLSPEHPDVVSLSAQIRGLESALESAKAASAVGGGLRVAGPGATAGAPVRVGGNVPPPTRTRMVNPEYPEIARSARVQGVVILEVVIDEQGRVADGRVLRSIPLLDQAALDAVRQWEFTPTRLNGVPVPVTMTMTVQFTLSDPPAAQ